MSDFLKDNNNSISINSTTDNYNSSSTSTSSNILAAIIPILILCAISTVIGFSVKWLKHHRSKKLRETFLSTYNYDHLVDQGDWEEVIISPKTTTTTAQQNNSLMNNHVNT